MFQLPPNFLPVSQMNSANPNGGGYRFGPPPQPAPQQDPMGGLGGNMGILPMLMASQGKGGSGDSGLLGLLGMNKPPSAQMQIPGVNPNAPPIQTTVSGALPDLGAQGGGIHGLWHSLMGMFGGAG